MRNLTATLIALALAAPALAHDDATLDASGSAHGGQVRMAGPYHYELVVGEGTLQVYLTDHADQPLSSQGVSGNAVVLHGGKATIPLTPAGEHHLEGQGDFESGSDMKVVISLTFPDRNAWQARFTPWERMQQAQSGQEAGSGGSHGDHQH
jgi:hypothetical protein